MRLLVLVGALSTALSGVAVAQDTGFSAGLVGGGALNGQYHTSGIAVPFPDAGAAAGVIVGYDLLTGPLLLGLSADASLLSFSRTDRGSSGVSLTTSIDNLATIRGRAGFVIDKISSYATAGVAIGTGRLHNVVPPMSLDETITSTHVGSVVGVGVEVQVTDRLSTGVEYLYVDLGPAGYSSSLDATPLAISHDFQVWRAIARWRF